MSKETDRLLYNIAMKALKEATSKEQRQEAINKLSFYPDPDGSYYRIKKLAKEKDVSVENLIVLAPANDPFYSGTKTDVKMAYWFKDLWEEFGFTKGVHIRRIHYKLVSQKVPKKANGTSYENTENDWNYLTIASKHARCLGLVPAHNFVDRRNPEAKIFQEYTWHEYEYPDWYMGDPYVYISGRVEEGESSINGYEYHFEDQKYNVEIWIEKSTMNDILIPICQKYEINLVHSIGFQSITSVIELLKRSTDKEKPTRIFYISDYDPAGDNMPQSAARQIEFWINRYSNGEDIKLQPIALTRQQVKTFDLPRTPIKETDRRKQGFEDKEGQGAVELDALEALYPGVFEKIVVDAIKPYRDIELEYKIEKAKNEANNMIWNFINDSEEIEEIEKIKALIKEKVDEHEGQLLNELAEPIEQFKNLWLAIKNRIEEEIELPEKPEAELDLIEEDNFLYSSGREYLEQLEVYKNRKAGL